MGLIAPAFLAGLLAVAIPVVIHMIHRERKETLAFPSLMFLRKIPYRSVRRQKIRHLLLLAMRCLAIAIVVAAFARPFFERRSVTTAAGSSAREIVVLIDRSYSMAHGTRWDRAIQAARSWVAQMRPGDRMSVVTFGSSATQIVEPTSEVARLNAGLADLQPSSEPTRFASGLRIGAQLLASSDLPRREIVLISDFHRFGWAATDDVPLPAGATVRTVDVSKDEKTDLAVAGVSVARTTARDRVQAVVTARASNLGDEERTVDATLELAGRRVETRRLTVPARATAQVVFGSAPVAANAVRGVVRITADSQPRNDAFYFTVAEESGASALVVEPDRARPNQSLFLTRALSVADDPPVETDLVKNAALGGDDLPNRSLIVFNEAELPGGAAGQRLRELVREGAQLVVIPGERGGSSASNEWRAVMPATIGAAVDRGDGARWASVDFSNALFEPFRAGRADFSAVTVTRYRTLTPEPDSARVIARLDDGAPLLVERPVGKGRVLVWAGSFDANWNDLPFQPLWVPFVHQLARRSMSGRESRAWFTAPHVLDLASEGVTTIESPSGERTRLTPDSGRASVELDEAGFYELRGGATAIGAGRPIAVNVDLAESDLSHFDPAELVASITSLPDSSMAGDPAFAGTPQELERRQALWWYLLLAAMLLLAAETLLSNRLSRRPMEPQVAVGGRTG